MPTTLAPAKPEGSRPEVPTYQWRIRTKYDPTQPFAIQAAYHSAEEDFVVFKDGHHKTVYLIATDQVLDVGRLDPALFPPKVSPQRK